MILSGIFKMPPLNLISQNQRILKIREDTKKAAINPTKKFTTNHTVTIQRMMTQKFLMINQFINKNKFLKIFRNLL